MEDILEIYSKPYNPLIPVICMDEKPIQLLNETRESIPATENHPERVDYEYERAGTASIFMFTEPLAGKREVSVRDRRTKIDWAIEMEQLLRTQYANIDKVILVCDNLNTHTRGAFYDAFPAEKAREIVKKIEFHYTPKHGSWLNIAECELSAMTNQCLKNRRFGTVELLTKETQEWAKKINQTQRGVNWQFSIDKARKKLKSIYPKIEC
jgi:DDE superfamily endonuclease